MVNAFLANNDIKSLIIILQQICNGFNRISLVTTPELVKQEKNYMNNNNEGQIVEIREFLSQVLNDIVYNIKKDLGSVQIIQEILEVNNICIYLYLSI